jgi:hypothetical protein
VAIGLARVVAGLTDQYKEDRLPLPDALRELEEIAEAAGPPPPGSVEASLAALSLDAAPAATALAPPPLRECAVCMDAPPAGRFRCGHASCCNDCLAQLQATATRRAAEAAADPRLDAAARAEAAARYVARCPTCDEPLGADPFVVTGEHVAAERTFVPPAPAPVARGRGGRGGRWRGRGGRGNASEC